MTDLPVINPDCDAEKILDKIYDYIIDLRHYTESKRKKRVINTIYRRFGKLYTAFVQANHDEHTKIAVSLRVFFREIQELFKIFGDEMEIFLIRKINNLGKSILKCLKNKL